ncbi:cyclic nucleotide-binding domain-containing protein [Maribellus comscasis]|uniref:Cyclic nucleotide-binding domain-containing protein n=1 Tax=Maribellus comscasis TaxID=2681766 RepID=A0A6I6JVD0_9BACT|nr:Crp/Fnr family transcriptional regulator [Maribellus comscasis]QGY46511.1 cyclic nucleotide-binding domain-containing protein [Maribellus comscasis]
MNRIFFNIQRTFNTNSEEQNAIRNAARIKHLAKNEIFLREGDVCKSIGLIEKGSMRLYYDSPEKEVCNDFFFENSVVGSFASFLTEMPSIVSIAAIEDCEIILFEKSDLFLLIQKYPSLKRLADFILQEQFLRAEKREEALLKFSPEKRFKNLLEEHPKIFKRVPLHYVASYLNITPETLSRYRTRFLV